MLSYSNLPNCFWGEALQIANYLQNRSPIKSIQVTKTSFKLWYK
uniref:Reverse transcriptase Ty1/copia-type domain-containing protein n=1 Tax=Physcomitrium patens TaxID=3218 RepID=A0A2K1JUC5_PHYPA|nr:hypothetical protein PHYPA_014899 [Physcomitrium patens]